MPAWLAALGANDVEQLRRRLDWDGMSLDDAGALPNGPGGLDRRSDADEAMFSAIQGWLIAAPVVCDDHSQSADVRVTFQELWTRIACPAMDVLARSLPAAVAAHYQADAPKWGAYRGVRANLRDDLMARLSRIGEPVLWKAFNRRRTPAQIVMAHLSEGGLRGSPARTIYLGFLEELRADGLGSLVDGYPVLSRQLSTVLRQWLQYSREILVRVHDDRRLLSQHFGLPVDARLSEIQPDLSDPHHGGRTVALLTFGRPPEAGSGPFRIVYKPKDLRLDAAFGDLLDRLEPPHSDDPPLRRLTVLALAGYGYMAWAAHEICASDQELGAFYRNAGRLAAVLHLLGCTDCHHENLIAGKDQLMLVDAETLFEGVGADHRDVSGTIRAETGLQRDIDRSVLGTGLLPQWRIVGRNRLSGDVSALGVEPPPSPREQGVGWIAMNTDGMMSGDVERQVALPTSLPVGFGAANRLSAFIDAFCDGFRGQLLKISENKERWLADDGYLAPFRTCRRRFIPRPTWLYSWFRHELSRPDALASPANQRLVLEGLARTYLVSATKPRTWPLFGAEAAQMEELDIPFFAQSVDSVDLDLPDGTKIENFLASSGYDTARRKVAELDQAAIEFQVKLIRGAVAARVARTSHGVSRHAPGAERRTIDRAIGPEDRLNEARAIGERLIAASISHQAGFVEWLATDVVADTERSRFGPLGPSLYSGRTGIALFLTALARADAARAESYRRTASAACADVMTIMTASSVDERRRWWRDQPLGLAGSGGILLAMAEITALSPGFARELGAGPLALVDALDVDILRSDRRLDIINGCAGLIGPLLILGSAKARMLAAAAGDNLIACQAANGGWVIPGVGATALTGFSHGASGIAAALARLHAHSGDDRYAEAASRALAYERAHFDAKSGNWPDFRGDYDKDNPPAMLSWCHGAPGIALARLCLADTILWDAEAERELHCALGAAADRTLNGDSLCCGRFGRAAILRSAARDQEGQRWIDAADAIEDAGVSGARARGGYSFVDTLGMFTGASGVGLALLDSLSDPEHRVLHAILSAGLCGARP